MDANDRPGLGTPPCTVDKGRVIVELGIGNWTSETDPTTRTRTFMTAEALVRVGVTDTLEAQVGWDGYGYSRIRNRQAGSLIKERGSGDVTLALRKNLQNPDGSGISVAVMPYVSLPVGSRAHGAGDWSGGVLIPMSFELPKGLSFSLTSGIGAAADSDGDGRHLVLETVAGLGIGITETISATGELPVVRDRDPEAHVTVAQAGLSVGWQPIEDLQFDAGVNIGLNRDSPDSEIYVRIVRRF